MTGALRSMKTEVGNKPAYKVDRRFGFINDLDGGIDIFGGIRTVHGMNILVEAVDALYLKTRLTPEYLSSSKAVYPEQKEKLIRFLEELKEDDNPVIIMVYLKKDI